MCDSSGVSKWNVFSGLQGEVSNRVSLNYLRSCLYSGRCNSNCKFRLPSSCPRRWQTLYSSDRAPWLFPSAGSAERQEGLWTAATAARGASWRYVVQRSCIATRRAARFWNHLSGYANHWVVLVGGATVGILGTLVLKNNIVVIKLTVIAVGMVIAILIVIHHISTILVSRNWTRVKRLFRQGLSISD